MYESGENITDVVEKLQGMVVSENSQGFPVQKQLFQ